MSGLDNKKVNRPVESLFLHTCKWALQLVRQFQTDLQPWGLSGVNKPGFVYDADLRAQVKARVNESLDIVRAAIDRHGLDEISVSYNGGKDCLVMLILILAVIHEKYEACSALVEAAVLDPNYKLDAIYINSEEPFPELTQFISESTRQYHLNLVVIKSSLKEGFEDYLQSKPKIRCIIVGIRHTDPYGLSLQSEQVTDHQWPRFLRIHPILRWQYRHIWDFLVGTNVAYCPMYDRGYTSLGGVSSTVPNPFLKAGENFKPAYTLIEDADERERLGRISRDKVATNIDTK